MFGLICGSPHFSCDQSMLSRNQTRRSLLMGENFVALGSNGAEGRNGSHGSIGFNSCH